MRMLWKLGVIVLLGVAVQWVLVHAVDDIDEAGFVARIAIAKLCGQPCDSPQLVAEAEKLFQRQCERAVRELAQQRADPAPRERVLASAGVDG